MLDRGRVRVLRPAVVARAGGSRAEIHPHAHRHPGRSAGASLRRAARAGVEPTSMKSIAAALVLIALPPTWALIDAVSFSVHNRSNGSIVSSGLEREYLLYVPRSYDPAKPAPLVISMHGAAGWPVLQMEMSGWNAVAEKEGFIVVYPAGVAGAGPRTWAVDRGPGLRRDVRYIADLIDKLEATYNIDRERIYANGLSNGGGMAFVLSCAMADRIAAVGMVGAAQTLPWSWCSSDRSVPMITKARR